MRSQTILITAVLAIAVTGRAAEPPRRDPAAIAALEKMSAFLRSQPTFVVQTESYTDLVLDSGQKIRSTAHGELRVQRPDKMRAERISDRKQRQYFYDGKTFTVYGPQTGYYATVAAPPTLLQTADMLEERYGLSLPLVDLFRWGTIGADTSVITAAIDVGPAVIDGVEVEHYAFRQPGLDWQIWIERGTRAVPRRLVLTTTDDPARPEHAVDMQWVLCTKHRDSEFTFVPPEGSQRIAVADAEVQRSTQARRGGRK